MIIPMYLILLKHLINKLISYSLIATIKWCYLLNKISNNLLYFVIKLVKLVILANYICIYWGLLPLLFKGKIIGIEAEIYLYL